MKFPFFASFIVFCLWLTHQLRKAKKLQLNSEKNYWEKEALANSTRRKPLNGLNYIQIPLEQFSFENLTPNSTVNDAKELLQNLSGQKIVNLTGFTNTDLKLKYGAPNISLLTEYDQNYTLLVRTLQTLAEEYYRQGFEDDAQKVLEFAISTGTDVSQSYFLLADLYEKKGALDKVEKLARKAASVPSILKNSIVHTLQESGPHSDLLRSL